MKKISVLIPDGENLILEYVINCFAKTRDVKVYVMSNKKDNFIRFSRHVEKFLFLKKTDSTLDWINNIDEQIEKFNIDLILPVFEHGIKELIKNKSKLKHKSKLVPLPSLGNFNSARNKWLLYKHLNLYNFACPDSVIIPHNQLPNVRDFTFPVIAKTVEGHGGGKGVKFLKDQKDLLNYYKTISFSCDTIIQEYIAGYDICTNVLCKDGEILAFSIQKATLFEKGDFTYQIGFDFVKNENLMQITKNLMSSLNWSGVANIDWRYDTEEKQFKAIEINTRYWFNTDASAIAGVNFPYLNCLLGIGISFEEPNSNLISYLNLRGVLKTLKKRPLMIFNFSFLKNNTPLFFVLRDPLPIIYKFIWRTKNIIISKFRN